MLRDIKSCEVIDIFLNIIYSFLTLKQINVNTAIIHCFYLNKPHVPYVLLDQPQEKQDDYNKCLKRQLFLPTHWTIFLHHTSPTISAVTSWTL